MPPHVSGSSLTISLLFMVRPRRCWTYPFYCTCAWCNEKQELEFDVTQPPNSYLCQSFLAKMSLFATFLSLFRSVFTVFSHLDPLYVLVNGKMEVYGLRKSISISCVILVLVRFRLIIFPFFHQKLTKPNRLLDALRCTLIMTKDRRSGNNKISRECRFTLWTILLHRPFLYILFETRWKWCPYLSENSMNPLGYLRIGCVKIVQLHWSPFRTALHQGINRLSFGDCHLLARFYWELQIQC